MALQKSGVGSAVVYHKLIKGRVHPSFAPAGQRDRQVALGLAFRTVDAPLGYLPFYARNDFDLSGETSFKEAVLARLPMDFSAAASPHTLLIMEAAEDPEFAGSGDADGPPEIGPLVRRDRLQHALTAASGLLVDGLMLAIVGPTINTLVGQMVQSGVRQFIISKTISAGVKQQIKQAAGVDLERFVRMGQ